MDGTNRRLPQRAMPRTMAIFLVITLFATLFPIATNAENSNVNEDIVLNFILNKTAYTVNGNLVEMDVSPAVFEGRTLMPIRYVAEPLGAEVGWDQETRTASVSLGDIYIELKIGESTAVVNGKSVPIDPDNPNIKPVIISSRTMLPTRFVSENLGCVVEWDQETKKVTISKGAKSQVKVQDENEQPEENLTEQVTPEPEQSSLPEETTPETEQSTPPEEATPEQPPKSTEAEVSQSTTPARPSTPTVRPSQQGLDSPDLSQVNAIWSKEETGKTVEVTKSEADIPVVMRVGRGYDVFGKYASVDSLKEQVLDINKLIENNKVARIRLDQAENTHIISESIREYSEDMSLKIGASVKVSGFSGSVKTNFDTKRAQQLNNNYSTFSYIVKKYGVYIKGTTDLRNYITAEAKKAINNNAVTAQVLFNTFGHYVLVDTITGGRIDYSTVASTATSTSFENFKVAVKAEYKVKVFSASADSEYENVKNKKDFDSNKDTTLHSYGGGFTLNINQFEKDDKALVKWEETLEENGTLVDFGTTTTRPLVPIWELCDNKTRADYLKAEFEKLNNAQENQWPKQESKKYITDIVFVTDENEMKARQKCPTGYDLVDADLNKGAGGDFIFLCYKAGEDKKGAITDLFLENSGSSKSAGSFGMSHNGNFAEYTRNSTDLNKGASGKYVYIWSTKDTDLLPITGIDVVFGNPGQDTNWSIVYWQNSKTAGDVNIGAGGDYIYIRFKR